MRDSREKKIQEAFKGRRANHGVTHAGEKLSHFQLSVWLASTTVSLPSTNFCNLTESLPTVQVTEFEDREDQVNEYEWSD